MIRRTSLGAIVIGLLCLIAFNSATNAQTPTAPTNFKALRQQDNSIIVTWTTTNEARTQSFYLWRGETADGDFDDLMQFSPRGTATTGFTYEYRDTDIEANKIYWYRLEEILDDNTPVIHGPILEGLNLTPIPGLTAAITPTVVITPLLTLEPPPIAATPPFTIPLPATPSQPIPPATTSEPPPASPLPPQPGADVFISPLGTPTSALAIPLPLPVFTAEPSPPAEAPTPISLNFPKPPDASPPDASSKTYLLVLGIAALIVASGAGLLAWRLWQSTYADQTSS